MKRSFSLLLVALIVLAGCSPKDGRIKTKNLPELSDGIQYSVDVFEDTSAWLRMGGWAFDLGSPSPENELKVVFRGEDFSYEFKPESFPRPDVSAVFGKSLDHCGYNIIIDKTAILLPGDYTLCFMITRPDKTTIITSTGRMVNIPKQEE